MYSIDSDNDITVLDKGATPESGQTFNSSDQLLTIAADWPMARFVEIWNSLPGVTEVRKFENRAKAVRRIYARLDETLGKRVALAPGTEFQVRVDRKGAHVEPVAKGKEKTTRAVVAPAAAAPAKPREGESKKAQVIDLMSRPTGLTLGDMAKTMGWQVHTCRGFVAGTLAKLGIKVESFKNPAGERTYRIAS